jgi:predicted nucleotidyltransferase
LPLGGQPLFVRLAADCNPNIIEILFVDDSDVLDINSWGEELREFKDNFISRKTTIHSKKIQRHEKKIKCEEVCSGFH